MQVTLKFSFCSIQETELYLQSHHLPPVYLLCTDFPRRDKQTLIDLTLIGTVLDCFLYIIIVPSLLLITKQLTCTTVAGSCHHRWIQQGAMGTPPSKFAALLKCFQPPFLNFQYMPLVTLIRFEATGIVDASFISIIICFININFKLPFG